MNSSDIAAIAFWPACAVLALVLGFIFRRKVRDWPRFWAIITLLVSIGANFIFLFFTLNGFQSTIFLFNFHFGSLLMGLVLFVVALILLFGKVPPESQWMQKSRLSRAFVIVGGALASFVMVYLGGSPLFGDYLSDRKIVSGTVGEINATRGLRSAPKIFMIVGEEKAYLTRRMVPQIKVGDNVRAEVGRGSEYVYVLEKLP